MLRSKSLSSSSKVASRGFSSSKAAASPQLPAFDFQPPPYTGMSMDKMKEIRTENILPMVTYYKNPICITDAKMQYMWDNTGKRYLDMFGGIVTVSVGHCHPHVVEALKKQSDKLWHTTSIYYQPKIHEYAEKLLSKFPKPLDTVLFVNSGSEANDMALMLSRLHTNNWNFLALRNGYHGMSVGTQGITALHTWHYPTPGGFGVQHVMTPDAFRGPFGGNRSPYNTCPRHANKACGCGSLSNCEAPKKYAEEVRQTILAASDGKVAGFIAEYIQGVGGGLQLCDGYLQEAYQIVRDFGGVCISDEVQTGFGRLGTKFWAFEDNDVMPDMVTMAKGIGNGFPLAAIVTTKDIAKHLGKRLHFNTYGGNPLASAVGIAVLEVIEQEKLQENSAQRGKELLEGLMKLKDKYEIIGDVRGKGLMVGVEIVKDKQTNTPAPEETGKIFEKTKDMGLLLGKGGLYGNCFRIKPPMCITSEDVKFTLEVFEEAVKSL